MPKPEVVTVPVIGRIVAGPPVPAVANCKETIILPKGFGGSGSLFALRVGGNSMVDAGIFENDIVVVRWQPTAENGDIVMALIDNEATITRFFKEDGRIRLQPENSALQPIVTDKATILGLTGSSAVILVIQCII
ncbi:MAG: LexA family protein [Desulfotomaculales bacterium]